MPEQVKSEKKGFKFKLNYKILGIVFGTLVLALALYYFKGYVVAGVVNGKSISRARVVSELERRGGQQVLEGLVNQVLIDQEAKRRGVIVTQQELDEDVKKIEDNMKSQGSTLETALIQQNLDREQFLVILMTNKKLEKLIADKINITDEEVTAYLDANKDSFPEDTDPTVLREQIKTFLQQQKVESESQKLFTELKVAAKVLYWARF